MLDSSVLEIVTSHTPSVQNSLVPFQPKGLAVDDEPLDIMLIEDTFSDALLTRMALDATAIPYKLATLRRGTQLVEYIDKYKQSLPDVIFLDLGLPDMDGFEVLAHLSEQSATIRSIPIVVLTAHKNFEFIQETYPLFICGYIHKPCNHQHMQEVLSSIVGMRSRCSAC